VTRPRRRAAGTRADRLEAEDDAERYKVVGPLRIQIALFNIYLNEADEQSRRLSVELSEWQRAGPSGGRNGRGLGAFAGGQLRHRGLPGSVGLARRLEHALSAPRRAAAVKRPKPRCTWRWPRRSAACCTSSPPAS
jgi:chemosensory pili system protein ChpA (sensor histidine kinase/response regulator)